MQCDFMKRHFFLAALAGLIFVPGLRAQQPARRVQNRLLLVFDTSSDMKRRLPAEEKAVERLSYTLFGQFQTGDSIGVWTFSHNLRTGEYPLEQWESGRMPALESNIVTFVKGQRYSKTTSFDDIGPTLDEVVRHSERLTTLIFCDGEGQMSGTPNDAAINAVFRKNDEVMRKARQPFVIVLRSQLGKYVGCTINSADAIQLPQFPPLPPPPAAVVVPQPTPAPAPPPPAPAPLVIIGTHVGTNVPPAAPPQPAPAKFPPVNPPRASAPTLPSTQAEAQAQAITGGRWTLPNPPSSRSERDYGAASGRGSVETGSPSASNAVAMISPGPTGNSISSAPNTNTVVQMTVPIPPLATSEARTPQQPIVGTIQLDRTETASISLAAMLAMGAGLLLVAVLLVFFVMRRLRRRDTPSLITESLKKN